ncbi:alpha/beta fold hydrolase [Shewanella sp. OMA3-2]|uniref:alpha/beta fold hydrolase n=1 Tax=Shewanella sp. OMA3-2 TaxID=2908650 RepID=UPI001F1A1881|nr:alpha/beta fold hydrolase [Shewanella sp. OMA3-2]UJF22485.1 alpha/beta hydrolase [Shewanella sp. OMA3-2]
MSLAFIRHAMVDVGQSVTLSVSQYGRVGAKPVVYLHGGPGAGCHAGDVALFTHLDLHVFFIDQRGSGRSIGGDLASNTLPALIGDIDLVRQYFAIEKWAIVGGSYGATLGWLYSGLYPTRVSEQVYWGLFLANTAARDWLYGSNGAALFFTEAFEAFKPAIDAPALGAQIQSTLIESDQRETTQLLLSGYYGLLHSADPQQRQHAILAWNQWEQTLASPSMIRVMGTAPELISIAHIEHHHAIHDYFSAPELFEQIAGRISAKTHLIQGELDWVCPAHLLTDFLQDVQHHHLTVEHVKSGYHSLSDAKMLRAVMQNIARLG